MNILVLNAGSSTLKFKAIEFPKREQILCGICERIGLEESRITYMIAGQMEVSVKASLEHHYHAVEYVLKILKNTVKGKEEIRIDVVGHRIAHGGDKFLTSTIIDNDVLVELEQCSVLAPLHNLPALAVIEASKKVFDSTPMVAVFDTSFHQTMPPKAFMYAIPYDVYETYKVRKYGFHGTSHQYAARKASEEMGISFENSKIIVCHLGNGASVTAVQNGESVDTSMGFTPLEGLVMGTRSGDIDPSVVEFLAKKMGLSSENILRKLNTESGLKGVSKKSSDFREVFCAMQSGDEKAKLAIEMFVYRVVKYIGSYIAVMNGLDLLVFTRGIGERSCYVREAICESFSYIGLEIDKVGNSELEQAGEISTGESKVKVVVVHADEELMIAQETYKMLNRY